MRFSAAVATGLVLAPLSVASQINSLSPRDVKRAVYAHAPEGFEKRTETLGRGNVNEEKKSTGNLTERETSTKQQQNQKIEISGGGSQATVIWIELGGGAERQQINEKMTGVNAAEHTIVVGGPGALVYSPPANKFEVGDMVIWEFKSKNHTVTQSTFDKPCEKLEGGFDTGFMPNPNDTIPPPRVAMQIMTSEPLWFKCSQGDHCQRAMVASINAKDGEKSHAKFQEKAIRSGQNAAGATSNANSTTSAGQEGSSSKTGRGSTTASESAKESSATSTRPEASTESSSRRPEPSTGSDGRTEAGTDAGGVRGQVGAADGAGTVETGQGPLIDGVCNCVVPCGNGGASSSETKQSRSGVERRQAGNQACTCVAECVDMSSTDASRGVKSFLSTANMAAMGSRGNTGSASGASGASGTSSTGSARTTSSLGSSMSSMAGMAGMAARR
ncbi:hypothetical protein G6O67_004766 [Ophiocordyceps sinensis]|uniref:Cupredoxin n=1 Tax=Ophiocordyceps sinensis TaxID=72228 RepID=A0A8H4PQ65_9HYPO|nr:hypothetical protein G6O67_004766 [Ophiocordyceps sinensis]